MLANAEIIKTVAASLQKYAPGISLTVDPVMIATSGRRLLAGDAEKVLKEELLPLATWITPNIPEAEALLGRPLPDISSRISAAAEIAKRWSCSCILKTGHDLAGDGEATDFVAHKGRIYALSTPEIPDPAATHGTGCTLSSAIAGLIAAGNNWRDCVCEAKAFVYGSMLEAAHLGPGCDAMYPPLENYRPLVTITELKDKK
jgi:hydroxymethylpyrimidine/phosphomethylpyrimidine kinase